MREAAAGQRPGRGDRPALSDPRAQGIPCTGSVGRGSDARDRSRRRPMGRRRQRQGDRPAGQPRRRGRQVQRRQQRRPHDRHRQPRSTRCTCCRPASSRPAALPIIGNGVVDRPRRALRRARRARRARRRHVAARGERRRARHHPYNRTLDKVTERFLGSRQHRHDRTRHRPDLRRQDEPDRASGCRTCSTRTILRAARSPARSSSRTRSWSRSTTARHRGRRGRGRAARLRRAAAADGRGHVAAARPAARRGPHRRARGRARPPCSTSTTAPTRSSRRRTRRPAARAPAAASRPPGSAG